MNEPSTGWVPDTEANQILIKLIDAVQVELKDQIIGMYLDGSLTSGDFDQASDIDFVVITRDEIPEDVFLSLQAMHDHIAALDSRWAVQLEGSYISQYAVRRFNPAFTLYPNLERGKGERLKWATHNDAWNIHRYVLHERGITIMGPAPHTLIDPVSPVQLRQTLQPMVGWLQNCLSNPEPLKGRGGQSYTVLTLCRILYTLETGAVASKPVAVRWAKEHLSTGWSGLIDRAWQGRHQPDTLALPEDVQGTLDLIRFTLDRSKQE